VISPIALAEPVKAEILAEAGCGDGGFGSSGR